MVIFLVFGDYAVIHYRYFVINLNIYHCLCLKLNLLKSKRIAECYNS